MRGRCTVQGNKCLADVCRPVALPEIDGGFTVVRPNATENCCLMTVHSDVEGSEQCHLIEVCEGAAGQEPEARPPRVDACVVLVGNSGAPAGRACPLNAQLDACLIILVLLLWASPAIWSLFALL